jgi:hypothetical protein
LKEDVGQKNNLANKESKRLKEMIKHFELIRGKDYKNVEKLELK